MTPRQQQAGSAGKQLRVFINYRHNDIELGAQLLHDRLADRLGRENVFLDVPDLQPGTKWLEEIKRRLASCDVLLLLIGPRWVSTMRERGHAAMAHPTVDYVRFEIQYALRSNSGICVIPVLVGDDVPFGADVLPQWLRALAKVPGRAGAGRAV